MNRAALWILVLASATVFFGWETYRACTRPVVPGETIPVGAAYSPKTAAAPAGAGSGGATISGMSSLLARPVFRPDRRPSEEGGGGNPQRNYETELARYTLLGVLREGDRMVALVVGNGAAKGERWEVGRGDSLPGFTVKAVSEDGLVLRADGREFPLPLYAGGPKTVGSGSLRTEVPSRPATAPPPATMPRPGLRQPPGPGAMPSPGMPGSAASPSPSTVRELSPPRPQAEILRNRMRRTLKPSNR